MNAVLSGHCNCGMYCTCICVYIVCIYMYCMCECMCTLYVGVHVCMCVYNSQEVELGAHTERCLTPPPHAALFVLQYLGIYS